MEASDKICSSCKTKITNQAGVVEFLCPKCAKEKLVRCPKCRKNAVKYTCSQCKFTGPN